MTDTIHDWSAKLAGAGPMRDDWVAFAYRRPDGMVMTVFGGEYCFVLLEGQYQDALLGHNDTAQFRKISGKEADKVMSGAPTVLIGTCELDSLRAAAGPVWVPPDAEPPPPNPRLYLRISGHPFDSEVLTPILALLPAGPVRVEVGVSKSGVSHLKLIGDGWQLLAAGVFQTEDGASIVDWQP